MVTDIHLQIQESLSLKQAKQKEIVFPRFQFSLLDVKYMFVVVVNPFLCIPL